MARWGLIAGPKRSDKVGAVRALVDGLRRRGLAVGGVVQDSRTDEEGRRCYDLVRLGTGERLALGSDAVAGRAGPDAEPFCHVVLRPSAFEVARRWLLSDAARADALVVGEVSKLEVSGGGHDPAIRSALGLEGAVLFLVVRSDQLFAVVERYRLEDDAVAALELPADRVAVDRFVAEAALAIGGPERA